VRLLLDTHSLLWFYLGDVQLSSAARAAIADPGNDKLVSAASYWELAIKVSLGKYILTETTTSLSSMPLSITALQSYP
jgi:PIN domain nuclease of toxin-antitoxin system